MNININRKAIIKTLICASGFLLFSNNASNAQNNTTLQEVQEIVAIVNDKIISLYDLEQRTLLIKLAGGDRELSEADEDYLQQQAMQALIDDRLKIQEAAKYESIMEEKDVLDSYNNYASQFELKPEELEAQMENQGVVKNTLLDQIRGSMAWQSIVGGLLEQQVNVTDDEVDNYIDKMERLKGKDQYRVSEIFVLITDNSLRERILTNIGTLHQQLLEGVPFAGVAQQFSQSSTAAVGGDLGWVMADEIPSEVNDAVLAMDVGDISAPIITDDGVYIVQVTDRRQILTENDNDIAVELMHLLFESEGADFEALNLKVYEAVSENKSCDVVEDLAKELGAKESGLLGTFRIGQLPQEIREEMLELEIGAGTNLYEEPTGFRSFILCDKVIPDISMPEYETVLEDLTKSRVQLIAKRHLRDLRRDAIVDYR